MWPRNDVKLALLMMPNVWLMKSKSKLKYIRTTGRQIKNCTANNRRSQMDRQTDEDRQKDRQPDRWNDNQKPDSQTDK